MNSADATEHSHGSLPCLSICIPGYGQQQLVRDCIAHALAYPGNEIEVIVCDDGSPESLQSVVEAFADSRLRYFRYDENVGHDLNILRCLAHARGEFGFLLRSRDWIDSNGIETLMRAVKAHPDATYITGSAAAPEGGIRVAYANHVYGRGAEALGNSWKLLCHPSGGAYNLQRIDVERLRQYLVLKAPGNRAFVVHIMLRLLAAQEGEIVTLRDPVWVYARTNEANDLAANRIADGRSPYAPELWQKRYELLLRWVTQSINSRYLTEVIVDLFGFCLEQATWASRLSARDAGFRAHYGVTAARGRHSSTEEEFLQITARMLDPEIGPMWDTLVRSARRNRLLGRLRYGIAVCKQISYGGARALRVEGMAHRLNEGLRALASRV